MARTKRVRVTVDAGSRKKARAFMSVLKRSGRNHIAMTVPFGGRGAGARNTFKPEYKLTQGDWTGGNLPSFVGGGYIQLLNACTLGTDNFNRIGRRIKVTQIMFRAHAWMSPVANINGTAFRIMVICDRQPNGAVFTLADLLSNQGNATTAFNNLDNRDRFKVLWDKHDSLGGFTQAAPSSNSKNYNVYLSGKKLPNEETTYKGNAGTIADIATCAYYIVAFADTASTLTFQGTWRIRYTDA